MYRARHTRADFEREVDIGNPRRGPVLDNHIVDAGALFLRQLDVYVRLRAPLAAFNGCPVFVALALNSIAFGLRAIPIGLPSLAPSGLSGRRLLTSVALTGNVPDGDTQQQQIIFDPIPRVDGIEARHEHPETGPPGIIRAVI